MKYIEHGTDIKNLKIVESATPVVTTNNSLLIQIKSFALNRADIMQRKGLYPPPPGESEILGLECSGIVIEVGASVKKFKVGDRVMSLLAGGGYAEYVSVREELVLPLPKSFSFEEGAAVPEAFLTAYLNLFLKGKVKKTDNVLVHAGASGVGVAAIQILKDHSKNIFVTVSNSKKAEFCKTLGAIPILYTKENFKEVIQSKAKDGVQLILDPVGAEYLKSNLELLSMDGTLILISLMSGKETTVDLSHVLRKRLKVIGSTLRNLPAETKGEIVQSFMQQFYPLLEKRNIVPVIDTMYKATQIQEAHTRMESNQNIGKIVLSW